jgi:hypothetical protein
MHHGNYLIETSCFGSRFQFFALCFFTFIFILPQIPNEIISNRHTFDLSIYFLLGRFLVVCSLVVCPRVVLSPSLKTTFMDL